MKFIWPTLFIACSLVITAHAQSYDEELSKLSTGLGASLEKAGLKTVAVGGFKDLNGKEPGLGKLLIEDLSVDLVNQNKGVSVVDRANLSRLMEEYKLTEEGLVDPENTKKLKLEGIDAIIFGTIVPFDNTYRVQLKAIATDSARVVAATRGSITKTETLDGLMGITQIKSENPISPTGQPATSDDASVQKPKQRVYELRMASVEVQSVTFFQHSGKVQVLFTLTTNPSYRDGQFFYHLISKTAPHKNYQWQHESVDGYEVAAAASDDQGNKYAVLLPFDPLATPIVPRDTPVSFKLEFQMQVANGTKIRIPQTFSFWFEFYYDNPSNQFNLYRCSVSDFPFDKIL